MTTTDREALPFVRVVVVNYRAGDLTLACVSHLAALRYPADRFEVVVVDNASGDGLVDRLRAEWPNVRVVANADNRGFGAGCNAGIALDGRWDAVALLNNDSTPHADWLDALVSTWRSPPPAGGRVGAVAGKVLLAGTEPPLVNSAGCDLRAGGFNADRGDGSLDDGSFDASVEVFGWSGASVLLDRSMIDDIGVFDESFFLYYEDVDMVWRGRRRGWSVVYTPGAVSDHDRGSSAGRGDVFWFHDTRNRLVVLARHAPIRWLLHAVVVQLRLVVRAPADGPSRRIRLRALWSLMTRSVRLVGDRRRLDSDATVARADVVRWLDR
jgi:N-acetylglucosaminyl-diphospho-decaprenol L-rhamnosyltransferase